MNHKELQACRKLLMLDVSEAAELVGKVSARTWQYWESCRYPVPQDVEDEMQALIARRLELMGEVDELLAQDRSKGVDLPYYSSFAEYQAANPDGTKMGWRLQQSVAALYYTEGHSKLI